jgi:hypothetical protein
MKVAGQLTCAIGTKVTTKSVQLLQWHGTDLRAEELAVRAAGATYHWD